MNRNLLLTAAMALLLIGGGCVSTPAATPTEGQQEEAVETESVTYVGIWNRELLTVDGAPQETVPATIVMESDSYVSTTFCTVSGSLEVEGESVVMSIGSTDCPTGSIPDVYHSRLLLSDDGEGMTLINTEFGAEVREEYSRQ